MSDVPAGTMSILRVVMDTWLNRNEQKAAKGAGGLTFWRDGMLAQLQAIERDGPAPEVVKELKENFESSKARVEGAIARLKKIRSDIGPNKIGDQLDAILHHDRYGKFSIRDDIEGLIYSCEVTEFPEEHREFRLSNIKAEAGAIRRQIEAFNGEVRKLQRLVQSN